MKPKKIRSIRMDAGLLAQADELYQIRGTTLSAKVEALVKQDLIDHPAIAEEKGVLKALKSIRKKNK